MNIQSREIDLLKEEYFWVEWAVARTHSENFPYLVIRVAPGVYSPIAIPPQLASEVYLLVDWARDFAMQHKHRCCLVVDAKTCHYAEPNGEVSLSYDIPKGGKVINWKKFQEGLISCIHSGERTIFKVERPDGKGEMFTSQINIESKVSEGPCTPLKRNRQSVSKETFPEIVGFCERDDYSRRRLEDDESYDYKFDGAVVYRLTKKKDGWEIVEFSDGKESSKSWGNNLEAALQKALCVQPERDEKRFRILVPVIKDQIEKAMTLMYYYGGYPSSYLPVSPELSLILKHFADPELHFLCYSKIPPRYIKWLEDVFISNKIVGQDDKRRFYSYRAGDGEF